MASADARKEAVEARRPPWLGKGPRDLMADALALARVW